MPAPLSSQGPAGGAPPPADMLQYLDAIQRFSASGGAPDSAADLSLATLGLVRARQQFVAAALSGPQARWAVLMHLTAGVRTSVEGRAELREAHFALAETLLPLAAPRDELAEAPERRALRRGVTLTVAYDRLRRQRAAEALPVLERALRLGEDADPHTLLALGMAEELLASGPGPTFALAVRQPALAARLELRRRQVGTGASLELERQALLESSEHRFRDALAADASRLPEARVRLARVLALRGRRAAAERELERVLREGVDAQVEYLARLLLGMEAARAGEWSRAIEQFRGAVVACPRAQSARLGLSLALRRGGDRRGARREADGALGLEPADDPWLRYHHEPRRGVAKMLEELCRQ